MYSFLRATAWPRQRSPVTAAARCTSGNEAQSGNARALPHSAPKQLILTRTADFDKWRVKQMTVTHCCCLQPAVGGAIRPLIYDRIVFLVIYHGSKRQKEVKQSVENGLA